jgi:hypothetical protein
MHINLITLAAARLRLLGVVFGNCKILARSHYITLFNNLPGNCLEGFLNVNVILCRGFEERHLILICKCLPSIRVYQFLFLIAFIADKNFYYVRVRVLFDLFDPVSNVPEAHLVSAVVCEYDSHGPFIIGVGDSLEPVLARSIPYLHFNFFVIDFDSLNFEINSS